MARLFANYALLALMALPAIGSGIVIALRSAGLHRDDGSKGIFRAVAGITAGLVLAIATSAVIAAAAGTDFYRADDWVRTGLGLDLSLSLDGVARRVAVIVVALAALLAACTRPAPRAKMGATHYALIGLLESAFLGAIIADDMLAVLMFSSTAVAAALLLLSRGSGARRTPAAAWLIALSVPAGAGMLAGIVRLACLHYERQGFLSFALGDMLAAGRTNRASSNLLLIIRCALAVQMIALLVPCTLKSGISALRPRAAAFLTIGAIAVAVVGLISFVPQPAGASTTAMSAVATSWVPGDVTVIQPGLARSLVGWTMLAILCFCASVTIFSAAMRDLLSAGLVAIAALIAADRCLWPVAASADRGDYFASPHLGTLFLAAAWIVALCGMVLALLYVRRTGRAVTRTADLTGLYHTHPGPAGAMTLCLLSIACGPLLAGFFGKISLVGSLTAGGRTVEAAAVLSATALLAGGAMKVLAAIFSDPPDGNNGSAEPLAGIVGQLWRVAITALAAATVILGLLPQLLMEPLRFFAK